MRGIVPLIVSAPGVDSVTMQPARRVPFGCVWLHSPPHSLALPWAKHFAMPLTRSNNHNVGHAISGISPFGGQHLTRLTKMRLH